MSFGVVSVIDDNSIAIGVVDGSGEDEGWGVEVVDPPVLASADVVDVGFKVEVDGFDGG